MTSRPASYTLPVIHQLEPLRNEQGDAYPWVPCMSMPLAWDESSPLNVRKRAAEVCKSKCPALHKCEMAMKRLEAEGGTPLGVWAGRVLNTRQVIERTARRLPPLPADRFTVTALSAIGRP